MTDTPIRAVGTEAASKRASSTGKSSFAFSYCDSPGLRYDVTPTGMHYKLIHYDIPFVDTSSGLPHQRHCR
jgi:hypothetical protein